MIRRSLTVICDICHREHSEQHESETTSMFNYPELMPEGWDMWSGKIVCDAHTVVRLILGPNGSEQARWVERYAFATIPVAPESVAEAQAQLNGMEGN